MLTNSEKGLRKSLSNEYCGCEFVISENEDGNEDGNCLICKKRLHPLRSMVGPEEIEREHLTELVRITNIKFHRNFLINA